MFKNLEAYYAQKVSEFSVLKEKMRILSEQVKVAFETEYLQKDFMVSKESDLLMVRGAKVRCIGVVDVFSNPDNVVVLVSPYMLCDRLSARTVKISVDKLKEVESE